MPDRKVSQFPPAAAITGVELIDLVQDGINVRATVADLAAPLGVPAPATTTPNMDGGAAVGTSTNFARADHVHPTDTSRAAVSALPVPSAVNPIVDGTATIGTSAAYARADHIHPTDTSRAAASAIPVPSSTTPSMAAPAGAIGTSGSYARADHVHPSDSLANRGRNYVHNSVFNIAQRGNGPFTLDGYTLDRWKVTHNGSDTYSISRVALTDADRAAIGDESATWGLQNTFTGSSIGGSAHFLTQYIEDARRLSGKTITVSFWAKCASGSMILQPLLFQSFGTGGSPSAGVQVGAQNQTITTTWQRLTWTIAVNSTAGKTFGTNNDSFTQLIFYFSAQGAFVQSGTITMWGIQLEPGSQPTSLQRVDPRSDLTDCQRFLYKTMPQGVAPADNCGYPGAILTQNFNASALSISYFSLFPTVMRAIPQILFFNPTSSGAGKWDNSAGTASFAATAAYVCDHGFLAQATSLAAGGIGMIHYIASAEP
jgi:hypothetical protein